VKEGDGYAAVSKLEGRRELPLTEPLVTHERLTLSNQTRLKEWLMKAKGWKPTQWNYKTDKETRKPVRTGPRLNDKVTKEPCPNLKKCGWAFGSELSDWLMLRSRRSILLGKSGDTGWIIEGEFGKIASDAITVGTPTARFRHRGIVNVPRVSTPYGKEFRGLFKAREGKVWVGWDASSLEACMEAHYVFPYDEEYAKVLVTGDVHTRNLTALGLKDRDQAKTFKYAITYGAQPPKIAEQMSVSQAVAKKWFDSFWEANPGLLQLKKELHKEWEHFDKKYIVGLDGRLIATRSAHSLLNSKLQSAGAIVMKYAMVIADQTITERFGDDAYGLIRYHDEEQWECSPEVAEEVGRLGVESIERAGKVLKLNVPVTGEYKVGNNWAETH
jgi:hypothetical protein